MTGAVAQSLNIMAGLLSLITRTGVKMPTGTVSYREVVSLAAPSVIAELGKERGYRPVAVYEYAAHRPGHRAVNMHAMEIVRDTMQNVKRFLRSGTKEVQRTFQIGRLEEAGVDGEKWRLFVYGSSNVAPMKELAEKLTSKCGADIEVVLHSMAEKHLSSETVAKKPGIVPVPLV